MTTRNLFTILMIYFIIKIHKCINYTYDVIYINGIYNIIKIRKGIDYVQ